MTEYLQRFDFCLARWQRCLAGFDLASIELYHASTTVPLLAIDRNFDTCFCRHDCQLLPDHCSLHGCAIDGNLLIVLGSVLESSVLRLAQRIIVGKSIFEPSKQIKLRGRGCGQGLGWQYPKRRNVSDEKQGHCEETEF